MTILSAEIETWPFKEPIRITGYTFEGFDYLVVTLRDGAFIGRGEATGIYYLNDTPRAALAQLEAIRGQIEGGLDRKTLQELLPPGCARNALDCALWDLEAQRASRPVWQLAGLPEPIPVRTTFTLGAEDPDRIARTAREDYAQAQALKLKLTGEPIDHERVRAVRAARPDVWIGVDANQGFTLESLAAIMPVLCDAGVGLIEQPLPIGRDEELCEFKSPIPLAADESVQASRDVAGLVGLYDVINIKLDKCGGLTDALLMLDEIERYGLKAMVGNMVGTSLAMAPAFLVAQRCAYADLDGPLALATDREQRAVYEAGYIFCDRQVWGGGETPPKP